MQSITPPNSPPPSLRSPRTLGVRPSSSTFAPAPSQTRGSRSGISGLTMVSHARHPSNNRSRPSRTSSGARATSTSTPSSLPPSAFLAPSSSRRSRTTYTPPFGASLYPPAPNYPGLPAAIQVPLGGANPQPPGGTYTSGVPFAVNINASTAYPSWAMGTTPVPAPPSLSGPWSWGNVPPASWINTGVVPPPPAFDWVSNCFCCVCVLTNLTFFRCGARGSHLGHRRWVSPLPTRTARDRSIPPRENRPHPSVPAQTVRTRTCGGIFRRGPGTRPARTILGQGRLGSIRRRVCGLNVRMNDLLMSDSFAAARTFQERFSSPSNFGPTVSFSDQLEYATDATKAAHPRFVTPPSLSLPAGGEERSESVACVADERPGDEVSSSLDAVALPDIVKTECDDLDEADLARFQWPQLARRGRKRLITSARLAVTALPLVRRTSERIASRNATPGPSRLPDSGRASRTPSSRSGRGGKRGSSPRGA
jgi:hypothetical protein